MVILPLAKKKLRYRKSYDARETLGYRDVQLSVRLLGSYDTAELMSTGAARAASAALGRTHTQVSAAQHPNYCPPPFSPAGHSDHDTQSSFTVGSDDVEAATAKPQYAASGSSAVLKDVVSNTDAAAAQWGSQPSDVEREQRSRDLRGIVCEVQLHLRSVYEIKSDLGHAVYKRMRNLKAE